MSTYFRTVQNCILKIIPILLLLLISCKNENSKNAEIIEIYRPIKPIASHFGEKLSKYPEIYYELLKDTEGTTFVVDTNIIKVDSVTKRVCYANEFNATEKDLPNKPFIKYSEIAGINFQTNEIVFTEEGSKKIRNIEHRVKYSNQFVLTSNRKSLINGYFVNSFTSQYVYGYVILYAPTIKNFQGKTIEDKKQKYYIQFYNDKNQFIKPNLKKNIALYKSFKKGGKVLE